MAMTVAVERISPAKAVKMLNKNTCNRHLRSGVVERYAADMKSGHWTECTESISFYDNGEIADGQHRLFAIIESGTTQTFIVARGVARKAGLNINVGLNRNIVDNARISGVNGDLTNAVVAITRAIETGNRSSRGDVTTNHLKLQIVERHNEAARWVLAHPPVGRTFAHSLVQSAIGRAWYYEKDKERLAQFSEVLSRGFMQDEGDSAAVAIRNHLLSVAETGFGQREVWQDVFFKVQNAIKYFMRKRPMKIVRSVKDEAYPLPKQFADNPVVIAHQPEKEAA